MESKKINQLATAVNPSTSDLAIIGDPVTGVSKKITWLQVSTLIGTAANLQQVTDNGATTTNPVTIGGLTITGLSTGVLKSDSGVISSVPFGAANGVATLAGDGKVPSNQLPSYVDDVVEVANYAALPVTGETGKIYITLDNNKVYRWGGSVYVEIAANNAIWGSITGTLANQTDLQNALNLKANDSLVVHLAGTETITGTKTFSNPSKNDGGILLQNGSSYSLSGYMNLGGMTDGLRFTSGGGISNFFTLPSSVGYTYTFPALSGTIVAISGGNSTQYIDGTGALQTFPTLISSDKLVKLVRNQSGATMTAGTIVYISGATGNKPLITKALATGDSTSAQTYGLVQADIANNADGYVVVIGNITDIDTSALTEGQQLYLSGTTAGAYTTTKPYAPIHLVYIGIVLRSHPTQGIIGVKIQNGYEMDELHNVDAQSPSNNDILSYNTSTSLWEHKQIATTLGFTPISLASLSATSPLSYNNTTGAFSIQVATASQNGYLSSTDWSTFNNKQAALGGTGFVKISGSTISYDNSTYYLASNPSGYITLASLSAGAGISYSNITGVISSTITQYTDALARAAFSESVVGLDYSSSTGVLSTTTGYAIPTTAKQAEWDTAYTNRITSLTTTGSSGAATLVSNTLNVPTYTLSGLGGQPLDADLTAIAGLSGTSGFLKKTAADTWVLDTNTYATDSSVVHLAGTETITGNKTFSGQNYFSGGTYFTYVTTFTKGMSFAWGYNSYTAGYLTLASSHISTTSSLIINDGDTQKAITLSFLNTAGTDRTYLFPNASGTLALTSDIPSLTGYVPYTGATTDVSLGNNTLLSKFVFIEGDGTQGGILSFKQYATSWTSTTNHTNIYATDTDKLNFNFYQVGGGKSFTFNVSGLTAGANRTYTMPDAAGTLALTSDIPSLSGYVTLATNQTISAIKKYTDYQQFDNGIKFKSDAVGSSIVSGYVSMWFGIGDGKNVLGLASSATSPVYYTYAFPNAAGTIALTSDIPSLANYVTLNGTQTITGQKTISRASSIYNGTNQSFLIDGAGGQAAITLNAQTTNYAYQTFAQNGVSKFEIGIVGTGGNGSYYINSNVQVGETGASIFIKKSNGYVGINSTDPLYLFSVSHASDIWHMAVGSIGGTGHNIRIGGAALSGTTKYSTLGAYINSTDNTGSLLVLQRDGGNVIVGGSSVVSDSGHLFQVKGTGSFTGALSGTSGAFTGVVSSSQLQGNSAGDQLKLIYNADTSYYTNISNNGLNFYGTNQTFSFRFAGGTPFLTLASTGVSTFGGKVIINTTESFPLLLTSASANQYLHIQTDGTEAMTRYTNTAAGSWYTGIRTSVGIGSLTSYHIYSTILAGDAFVINTDGTGKFAAGVTATSFVKTGGTSSQYLMADGSVSTGGGGVPTNMVTTDTTQTITGQKTISKGAVSYGGTVQSFLIDGAGENAALTINAGANYAYLNMAQAGVTKFEIGAEGAATNKGSLYFNHNIQVGSTGAALYLKKSNGYVGINQTNPTYQLHVSTDANEGIFLKGSGAGVWMNIQSTGKLWSYGAQSDGAGIYQRTDGLYTLFIKDNGFTTIGGTDPTFKFNVYTDADVWHMAIGGSTGTIRFGGQTSSGGVIQAYTPAGVTRELYIQRDGSVAIFGGTTNYGSYKLQVTGSIYATADVIAYSDISVKKNIRTIENALERITKSRGVVYDRKDIDSNNNIGFIAQELELEFPELISLNTDGTKGVKYQNAVAVLFEAIKEQQNQINNLKKQLV